MFAAIAGCVLVLFVFFPTILLILYPTRLFRKCVSCCGFRRWYTLHMFVESFQGQYKDGTNGTRDFRMVSASFLVLRILILVLFLNRHRSSSQTSQLQCAAYVCFTCFYAITRPYKLNFMNNVDIIALFLLEIFSLAISNLTYYSWIILGLTLLLLVPHFVLICYVCYALAKKGVITHCLKRKYDRCVQANRHTNQAETDVETESDCGLLPDRLINPEECCMNHSYPPQKNTHVLSTQKTRQWIPKKTDCCVYLWLI